MNHRSALFIALMMLVSVSSSIALAQHQHSAAPAQTKAPDVQSDPMQQCQQHHAEGVDALDRAAKSLAQTKQLSDADQIRAAIDTAQQQIAEAKHHLSMCPMAQDGSNHTGTDHSQHQGHKMKCMSKDSQAE